MLPRLRALLRKEFQQFRRDRVILLVVLYMFTVEIVVAGAGLDLEVRDVALAVYDLDGGPLARELAGRFRPPYFRPAGRLRDDGAVRRALDRGDVTLVLTIPSDFSRRLRGGREAELQLLADGTFSYTALTALGYAHEIVARFGGEQAAARGGRVPPRALETRIRVLYNPTLRGGVFMSLAELFSVITLLAVLLPAAAMVRERESGTVEQLLVTPARSGEVMLAKIVPMVAVTLLGTLVAIATVLRPVFAVPLRGSLVAFLAVTVLFVFTTAGLGLLLASFSRNMAEVILLVLLVITPILFLSGTWTPVEAMPGWMAALSYLSPLKYYLDLGFGIFLKGVSLAHMWDRLLGLTLLGGAVFAVGAFRFRGAFA